MNTVKKSKHSVYLGEKSDYLNTFQKIQYFLCKKEDLNTFKDKLQKLAGIHKNSPAILNINENINIELNKLPSIFTLLRYKVAGFNVKILNKEKLFPIVTKHKSFSIFIEDDKLVADIDGGKLVVDLKDEKTST